MAGKSTIAWPFKVTVFLPAGHKFGKKNKESSRSTLHRTQEDAFEEVSLWKGMGHPAMVWGRQAKKRVEVS